MFMWKLYAFLSAFFAALTAVFAKAGVRDVDSDLATAIRTTIILIFGCHFSEVKDVNRNTWVFLIFSGLSTGLSWLFYFKAIQLGDVSRVAPIDKLSVVITILLAFLFLHEQPSLKVVIGAVLIASGSIFMIV